MLANVLAAGNALGARAALVTGFVDDEVNHIARARRRRAKRRSSWSRSGPTGAPAPAVAGDAAARSRSRRLPLSSTRSGLPDAARDAAGLAARERRRGARPGVGRAAPGRPQSARPPRARVTRRCRRRARDGGTRRSSDDDPAPRLHAAVLARADHAPTSSRRRCGRRRARFRADVPSGLVDLFLIVNAVDGIAPGAYVYRAERARARADPRGRVPRPRVGYLTLEQALGGRRRGVIFFLAPLDAVLAHVRATAATGSSISRRASPAAAPISRRTRRASAPRA